jgi:arginine deiminase
MGVHSEVGRLKRVLVCRPGLAQQRLTPANCRELLFDDVLWVAKARTDHYAFVGALQDQGVEVRNPRRGAGCWSGACADRWWATSWRES